MLDSRYELILLQLEPFIHQVGGHSSMLCLDEATVCKPLVKRELQFYETLPEAVSKFTPHFYGVIQVNVQPEEEGYVTLTANPPKFYQPISSSPTRRCVTATNWKSLSKIN